MTFVALHEWGNRPDGEYNNNPADPGGETKYGIAKRSHPELDIQNLSLADAMSIYLSEYWNAYCLDSKPYPYSVALMDAYVQHSPKHVKQWDDLAQGNYNSLIKLRRDYYLALIDKNPSESVFKKGWMNRLNDLGKYCDILVQS